MPLINQYWKGFPAVSVFQLNKCLGGTQIIRDAIESPKPFLNQYALDISGV
jgi:hypothetical protein